MGDGDWSIGNAITEVEQRYGSVTGDGRQRGESGDTDRGNNSTCGLAEQQCRRWKREKGTAIRSKSERGLKPERGKQQEETRGIGHCATEVAKLARSRSLMIQRRLERKGKDLAVERVGGNSTDGSHREGSEKPERKELLHPRTPSSPNGDTIGKSATATPSFHFNLDLCPSPPIPSAESRISCLYQLPPLPPCLDSNPSSTTSSIHSTGEHRIFLISTIPTTSTAMSFLQPRGGPYRSPDQASGELPSIVPDVPISIVLMVVYILAGAANMYLLITNKKRGHKFLFNGMVFGLCNVRLFTFILRTAWAVHPTNIRLGIASMVFVYAGTILLYIANLFFVQRIVRAQHPSVGWSKPFSALIPALVALIVVTLLMIIVAVIQSFFTLQKNIHRIDRDIQLYAQTCYATMAFLPIPMVLISTLAGQHPAVKARRQTTPVDKFGRGRMTHKILLVIFSACILSLGAGFRAGTTWKTPVLSHEADGKLAPQVWYFTKAAFYSFNFATELIVVFAWLAFRIDHMFYIPNKSKGSYNQTETHQVVPAKQVDMSESDA